MTTRPEARFVLPDGSEADVSRRGGASILEQKRLVRIAARLQVDCLVAEIMSIRPDAHRVEAHRLLKPHIVAVTNVRHDHTDAMGEGAEAIAAVLSSTVCRGTTAFVPEHVPRRPFAMSAHRESGRVIDIAPGASAALFASAPELVRTEFSDNLDLVCTVARHLGIPDQTIVEGIRRTRHDAGRLRISVYRPSDSPRTYYLVNAFAANDPESTWRVLLRVKELLPSVSDNIAGILNLRDDRIPRTLQWVDALNGYASGWFRKVFLTGNCPAPLRGRIPSAVALGSSSPRDVTERVLSAMDQDCAIFGFGNFAGAGKLLAAHWVAIGEDYGI